MNFKDNFDVGVVIAENGNIGHLLIWQPKEIVSHIIFQREDVKHRLNWLFPLESYTTFDDLIGKVRNLFQRVVLIPQTLHDHLTQFHGRQGGL